MPETRKIFDEVASHYDWLNTLFSLGIHKLWRKKLAEELRDVEYNLDKQPGRQKLRLKSQKNTPQPKRSGLIPA